MDAPYTMEFKASRSGKEQLYINGYRYSANRRNGNTVYWRCGYHTFCHVTVIVRDGQIVSFRGEHVCPQKRAETSPGSKSVQSKSKPSGLFSIFYKARSLSNSKAVSNYNPEPDQRQRKCGATVIGKEHPTIDCYFKSPLSPASELKNINGPCKLDVSHEELQVPIVDPEESQRLQFAAEIREAWAKNRTYFMAECAVKEKKWKNTKAVWSCCLVLPNTDDSVKVTKPIRGTGIKVEQSDVPIKTIDPVELPMMCDDTMIEENSDSVKEEAIRDAESKCSQGASKKRKREEVCSSDLQEFISEWKKEVFSGDRNPCICPICNKFLQSSMFRHLRLLHGVELFQCIHCNQSFTLEVDFLTHAKSHDEERPFCCDICEKRYPSSQILRRHLKSHTSGKTFPCYPCRKNFRKEKHLQLHNEKVHHSSGTEHATSLIEVDLRKGSRTSQSCQRNPRDDEPSFESSPLGRMIPVAAKKEAHESNRGSDGEVEAEPSTKPIRPFTLEELKYVSFLQPKVVLSTALTQFLTGFLANRGLRSIPSYDQGLTRPLHDSLGQT